MKKYGMNLVVDGFYLLMDYISWFGMYFIYFGNLFLQSIYGFIEIDNVLLLIFK